MRYAQIRKLDISDGPGCRVSLYVQGCHFHCDGCWNEDTWDFSAGEPYTKETEDLLLSLCERDYIKGLSILGGEPLEERNLTDIQSLCQRFKEKYPEKTIWLWTGYQFEHFSQVQLEICAYIDVIIDGPFINEKRNLDLKYRGSSNQRVINIPESIRQNQVVLLDYSS